MGRGWSLHWFLANANGPRDAPQRRVVAGQYEQGRQRQAAAEAIPGQQAVAEDEQRPAPRGEQGGPRQRRVIARSEEHTSELQSLMRNSSAVFCSKQNNNTRQ